MELQEYLLINAEMIDRVIESTYGCLSGELGKASAHLLLAGGKHLRPALFSLSADACVKGSSKSLVPAALALDLTHTFTLIHDDIMDGDSSRRGVPTVHTKWDESTAILAGDVLYSRAYESICCATASEESKVRAISMLARTCVEICEGQFLDMSFEKMADVTESEYLEMIRKKTGVLYAAAAGMGAILSGGKKEYSDSLYNYGINIGMAFQIQDDLIDLVIPAEVSGKDRASDIREGKKTIIAIKALKAGFDLRQYKRNLSESEIDSVIEKLNSLNVLEEVKTVSQDLVDEGIKLLDILPDSMEKRLIIGIGNYFINRGH